MEESCAYCGEVITGECIRQNDVACCCEECAEAYNEEALLFMEEDEQEAI